MLLKKEYLQFILDVMTIPGEFQHSLVVADIDKKKISNVVRKICIERRKISLLNDLKIRKQFEEKVIKLVDVGAPYLLGYFMDRILRACDEVCGKKRVGDVKEIHGGGTKR